jgi:hypothetical protein
MLVRRIPAIRGWRLYKLFDEGFLRQRTASLDACSEVAYSKGMGGHISFSEEGFRARKCQTLSTHHHTNQSSEYSVSIVYVHI